MILKTVTVEYDKENDDYILPLGDELCQELGWAVGDTIKWIDNKDGSWTIEKVRNDQKLERGSNQT